MRRHLFVCVSRLTLRRHGRLGSGERVCLRTCQKALVTVQGEQKEELIKQGESSGCYSGVDLTLKLISRLWWEKSFI